MKALQILIVFIFLFSCAHKNSKKETNKYLTQFKKDVFEQKGKYVWTFDLLGGEQVSTHTFYTDSITYTMTGKVYSTEYTMKKLSYEKDKNKWIGENKKGVVFVLFIKENTDSSLTIYKRKCKANGIEEALNYEIPALDETDDHGWNIFNLNENKIKDVLSISGNFSNADTEILINDSILTFNQKEVKKMSFHAGERRWVGKYQGQYLQVFLKSLEVKDSIQISAIWFNDLEELYSTKYNSIKNWKVYARQ